MGRVLSIKGFSYKLIEGEGAKDNRYFAIKENNLIIDKELDWSQPKYNIRVQTMDSGGLGFSKSISIDIRYRNKPPYKIHLSR